MRTDWALLRQSQRSILFVFARALSSALIILGLAGSLPSARGQPRTNLLLVTIDTLRADHLGCYGYSSARTPALDNLAEEGLRFERAYSPVPLTLPAHASLLTGTYPVFHGIRDNSGFVLSPDQVTLAEALREAGFRTAAFVGAFVLDSKFGLGQGFDYYFDDFDLSRYETISPGYIQRPGSEVVDRALDWLEKEKTHPFFAWVHLYDPHDPYEPPEPYLSRHPGRPYDGEIEFADDCLGRLLRWLRTSGVEENTLVIAVGDHGESLGEHGEDKHGLLIYNATLQVPLIIRLPGADPRGRVIGDPVSLVDLFPTVVQILDLDRKDLGKVQGRGISALWLGKTLRPVDLYAESFYPYQHFGWSPLRAVISGDFKYIQAPSPELYNLVSDFEEKRNLANDRSALSAQFDEKVGALLSRFSSADSSSAQSPMDAETLERLQSLGYVALSAARSDGADFSSLPDPKDQMGLYNEITRLFEMSSRGEYQRVIPGYRRILGAQPGLKIVRYKLGQAYYQTGDYQSAIPEFQKAIELGGESALATFDLAQTYLRLNRVEDAILGFRQTLELDPSHYRARTNLGVLYKNQGKIAEAIFELEKALEVAPGSVLAMNNLAISYSLQGDHATGVEILKRALDEAPSNAVLHANLALVYRNMGNEAAAKIELEKARQLNPALFQRPQ